MAAPRVNLLRRRRRSSIIGTIPAVECWVRADTIDNVGLNALIPPVAIMDQSSKRRGPFATTVAATFQENSQGFPAIRFNGTSAYIKSQSFTLVQPFRQFLVVRLRGIQTWYSDGGTAFRAAITGNGAAPDAGFTPNGEVIGQWAGTAHVNSLRCVELNGPWFLVEAVFNGASSSVQLSGSRLKTGGNPGTQSLTGGVTLGASGSPSNFSTIDIAEAVWCDDSTLSAAQSAAIRAELKLVYGLRDRKRLICDGNSLVQGVGATPGGVGGTQTLAHKIMRKIAGGEELWRMKNNGVSAEKTTAMGTFAVTATDPYLGHYGTTVLFAWEIRNEILLDHVSGATAEANYKTYWDDRTAAAAAGGSLIRIAATAMPGTSITGADDTARLDANIAVRANYTGYADALVDFVTDSRLNDATNLTYFGDGTHLTDAGYEIAANMVAAAINPLL